MSEEYEAKIRLTADASQAESEIDKATRAKKAKVEVPAVARVDEARLGKVQPVKVPLELTGGMQTAEQLAELWRKADKIKVSGEALGSFNALQVLTAAMHGNFAAAGAELAKVNGTLAKIGPAGAMAFGAAVYGVVSLGRAIRDLVVEVGNLGRDRGEKRLANQLKELTDGANAYSKALEEASKAAENLARHQEKMGNAKNDWHKSLVDLERYAKLENATDDRARDKINAEYDRKLEVADEQRNADALAERMKALEEADQRDRDAIANAEETAAEARKNALGALDRVGRAGSADEQKRLIAQSNRSYRLADEQDAIVEERERSLAARKLEREALQEEINNAAQAAVVSAKRYDVKVADIDRGHDERDEQKRQAEDEKARREEEKSLESRRRDEKFRAGLAESERRDREKRDYAALKTDAERIEALRRREGAAQGRYAEASKGYDARGIRVRP